MDMIVSPVIMNGLARDFLFSDVKGYKKTVKLSRYDTDVTYITVSYVRGDIAYCFQLYSDRVTFFKLSHSDNENVTYEEFEKFCKISCNS